VVAALAVPAVASADRYVYASNGFPAGTNNISALHINSDGSLTPVSGSPFSTPGTVTEGLAITPDAQHLYVAHFGTSNISGFNISAAGGLSAAPSSPFGPASSALGVVPSPDGQHLWVWNHNADTIGSWTISSDGSLSQIPGSPTSIPATEHNPFAGSADPDGRALYVPNENSTPVGGVETNKVTAYSVGSDGSLGAHQNIQSGNASAGGSNPFGSGITPDGEFYYVSNPEDGTFGTLSGYSVSAGGFLTALPGFPMSVAPGNHPLNIAASPDSQHLYVATRGTSTVNAYNIASNGSLSSISGSPFATGGANGKALALTPDGKRLYVSNNGSDDISGFNVASDGSLSLIPGSPWPTGGTDPDLESIAITPNQAPTSSFAVHSSPNKKRAKFNGSGSTDTDGTVATYTWDFGDGFNAQSNSPKIRHRYMNPGLYTVTLTVTDDEGCSVQRIFTGKATLCNGVPSAATSLNVHARKLTIHYSKRKARFKGKLKSDRKFCRREKVKLVRREHQRNHVVDRDRTNQRGMWRIKLPDADGKFLAVARQQVAPDGETCLATRSPKLKVG
jgi:6-phosphogluconolactonase (cycloisomerase 2 family)